MRRIRHIKCDEQKPSCQKCLSTGRTCEGYSNLPPKRARKVASSPGETQPSILPMPYRPSMDIQGSHAERRSFHFIQAKNPADIFGRCEVDFWNVIIPRFSHSHPAVRQSLLALSAVYEVYEQQKDTTIKHFNLAIAVPHALQQYSKAVTSLTVRLGSPENDPRAVLISCLIFAWIEVMMDNTEIVLKHLVGGVAILSELKETARRKEIQGGMFQFDREGIYIAIARSLLKLRFQTGVELPNLQDFNLIRRPLPKETITSSTVGLLGDPCSSFSSLSQLEKMVHFGREAKCLEFIFIDDERVQKRSPTQKKSEGVYRDRYANLHTRGRIRSLPNLYNELDQVTIQAVNYTMEVANSKDNTDETGLFKTLVDLVEEISNTRKGMDSPPVLDSGVLPSLFYTLLVSRCEYEMNVSSPSGNMTDFLIIQWCKDPSIRCKAWKLLRRAPGGEGFWQRERIIEFLEMRVAVEDRE